VTPSSLVEGLPTILVGVLAFLVLPSRPETTRLLKESERKLALSRLAKEVASEGKQINWRHVALSLMDYKAWMVSTSVMQGGGYGIML
jgi:hypothetical protein